VVAPEAFTEHPNWPANYGAWYVSQVLDVLTAEPGVWSKTALFLMFDENDGFFDHLVPPVPVNDPAAGGSTVSTAGEFYTAANNATNAEQFTPGPYGLGIRVPMLVISPWSKGGWVSSELFDHTSIIRFVEKRFGVIEPHISPWRRAICGDLTSAFDFTRQSSSVPPLPSTAAYVPPDDWIRVRRTEGDGKPAGRAKITPCAVCGEPATDWAYDGLDPDEKRDRHSGHVWSANAAHYRPVCAVH
jgi:phospholipase C